MTTGQRTKTAGGDATPRPMASPVAVGRNKLRRSPLAFLIGAVVFAAGLLGAWWMWASSANDTEVVSVTMGIERGQIITADDLSTVRIGLDQALRTVPGSDLQTLVGKRAAADMLAGTLVSPDGVTEALLPPTGMSVVAVPIDAGLVPSVPILAGDTVRLVQTPSTGGELVPSPVTVTAEVVNVTEYDQATVVDVLVPSDKAGGLAALAATGRVALVLDSRAR